MNSLGHTIVRLSEVPSTNSLVLETPSYLGNHGLVVVAHHQSAGRGRLGRKFVSLPGGQLLFSVVLHPQLETERIPLLSLLSGIAVSKSLDENPAIESELKWPNDVLIGGKKVCGILVELRHGADGKPHVVVGIGVNCHGSRDEIPEELRDRITTLTIETGQSADPNTLMIGILAQLETLLGELEAGNVETVLDTWRARARCKGRRVKLVSLPDAPQGIVENLTGDGSLRIRLDNGEFHIHRSGEMDWLD